MCVVFTWLEETVTGSGEEGIGEAHDLPAFACICLSLFVCLDGKHKMKRKYLFLIK